MVSSARKEINIILLAIAVLAFALPVFAAADKYVVLKIAPEEKAAVMRVNNGEPKMVRVGQAVGKQGTVKEVAPSRVVVVEGTGKNEETVIIRLEKDKQTVERLRRHGAKRPILLAPGKDSSQYSVRGSQ